MDETLIKPEEDYSKQLDEQLPKLRAQSKAGDWQDALEGLLLLEKKARQGTDLASSVRVLTTIIDVLVQAGQWEKMNEVAQILSKKHGQLKSATTALIRAVIDHLEEAPSRDIKIATINNVRTITEGKIFLELERARVTRVLAEINKKEGKIAEAAELMGELQVETFSSMEMREKVDFIMEQVQLYISKGDYTHAQIASKRILPRYFADEEVADQKLVYYQQNVEIALQSKNYLEVCQHLRHIYDTKQVQKNEERRRETLCSMVLFAILAPFDNLQNDLLNKLKIDPELQLLEVYDQLVQIFTAFELIRWPKVQAVYKSSLQESWVFSKDSPSGEERWADLRSRVIEHNIRVVSRFYSRISLHGLSELLDLNEHETESTLAKLVVNGTVYARINRPKRVISFQPPQDTNAALNAWSHDTAELLQHVETIGHLIAKEEMNKGLKA